MAYRPKTRTVPRFELTGKTYVPITQKNLGRHVNGRWEGGIEHTISREVNVQPLKYHEIMQMPESDRTKEWIVLYSAEEMNTSQEPVKEADVVLWQGKEFKIMKVRHWQMGVLDHWEAHAARTPESALEIQ